MEYEKKFKCNVCDDPEPHDHCRISGIKVGPGELVYNGLCIPCEDWDDD